jgi:hypothetical protein
MGTMTIWLSLLSGFLSCFEDDVSCARNTHVTPSGLNDSVSADDFDHSMSRLRKLYDNLSENVPCLQST